MMEEIAKRILYQVYVGETKRNINIVVKWLEYRKRNNGIDVSTEICDDLDIQRKYNRAEIRKVLTE